MTWEHMHAAAERENEKLYARIERLERRLKECADVLEGILTGGTFHAEGFCNCCEPISKEATEELDKARAELAKDIDDE